MLFQGNRPAVHLSVFQGDNAVERMMIISDTSGIQKQGFAAHIHKGTVGMTEQEQIQILFLSPVAGAHHGLLDAVGVTVTDQDSFVFPKEKLLIEFCRAEITVAGNLVEGNLGEEVVKLFAISPTVSEMQNHVGIFPLDCLYHIADIAVGIRENQNLHENLRTGDFHQYTMFWNK